MNPFLEEPAQAVWYVHAQGRVWGPYPDDRIETFVKEGRVAAATLIATTPGGPFRTAAEQGVCPHPFDQADAETVRLSELTEQAPDTAPVERVAAPRPLLVFATLATLDEMTFETALAIHGPYERLGQGLWLVRARLGAAALRNALSRRLRSGDTLLVVEAPLSQAAWFNLDQAEERRLRTLWSG